MYLKGEKLRTDRSSARERQNNQSARDCFVSSIVVGELVSPSSRALAHDSDDSIITAR